MLGLENRVIYDLKDVMEGRCTLANAMIRDKRQDNLYLLPACKTIHIQYFHGEDLKIVVEELKNQFDYILLDTPAGIESGFIPVSYTHLPPFCTMYAFEIYILIENLYSGMQIPSYLLICILALIVCANGFGNPEEVCFK